MYVTLRFLFMFMIMNMLMSADLIDKSAMWYRYIKLEENLPCCTKDLWGQKSGWGTFTSYILSTPCTVITKLSFL